MKRFLAFVGLLFVCVGPVTADYLFIKIDLNKVNSASEAADQPGAQPGFGGPGMQPGMGPGPGGKKGFGKGGGQFGPQPGGAGGLQPGGAGGLQPGGAGGLQVGAAGGLPAAGAGGPMGLGGQPGMGNSEAEQPPHWVMAYIELRSKPQVMRQTSPGPAVTEADHRFGRRGRFPDAKGVVEYAAVAHESVGKQFNKNYGKYVREANDAAGLYRAASWALTHGLTKDFHHAMSILAKVDPKHFAVVNYQRVQAELPKPPAADDPTTREIVGILKDEGLQLNVSEAGHYGLLAKASNTLTAALIKRRLMRFEETFDNFYYWFALQENATQPAMPKHRLYAVMVDDKERFHGYHATWSKQPMVADSFTPRRDNLIFLSTKRLDEDYILFEKSVQTLVAKTKLSREELISGAVWDKADSKANLFAVSAVQTLAIMQKAMDDESERAAISHEAIRQLLFATGMLPRLVNVPEWVQSGMAAYFDTPRGALYTGIGLPSWSNLVAFKHYVKQRKLGGNAQDRYDAFIRTISNRYFIDALRTEDEHRDKTERESVDATLKQEREIAQSTAWSLVYYVLSLERKLPQWQAYTKELNQLPRDMELDERTLQLCFGRAFGLVDPSDPTRLDPRKTGTFADSWFNRINQEVILEVPPAERLLEDYRYPVAAKKKSTNQQGGLGIPMIGAGPGANPNIGPVPGLNANPALPGAGNLKGGR